ncbi:MAG TPA: heat-inducible transcription repressor HrcA [Clostridiales bacterium]|jgi:heat-inducible transcriptional repressor|nr:heat-inducible transcription repressor HrcA [Clostridiales bacterium]HCG35376.1 heat-inducible transcription repressor HrcA [Clostridiales bacterium]
MELSERKKQILKSIIDAYILSGEPVGSKYVAKKMKLAVSSATIRNEMSELEQYGLLEQPHTSAGRVPSDKGYRVYVDSLMQQYRLTMEEIALMNELLQSKLGEMNALISEATKTLSLMTGYTTVAVTAKPRRGVIRRFEAVYIHHRKFLFVMITNIDSVRSREFDTEFSLDTGKLAFIVRVLNERLTGIDLSSISLPLIISIEQELGEYRQLVSPILRMIYEVIAEIDQYHVHLDGIANLLSHPEFSEMGRVKDILAQLEERQLMIRRLMGEAHMGTAIYIGKENEGMKDVSFVVRPFRMDNDVVGAVGLIGPKRMKYSSAIARLEYLTRNFIEGKKNGENHE